jgi:hypothetical protein
MLARVPVRELTVIRIFLSVESAEMFNIALKTAYFDAKIAPSLISL